MVFLGALLAATLAGCAVDIHDIGREPRMTALGHGLPQGTLARGDAPLPPPNGTRTLWDESRADLFRDPRARRVGDVITVSIAINDKATLDNSSERSRDAKFGAGFTYSIATDAIDKKGAGSISTNGGSSAKGQGSVDRSEKIQFLVAAVVTDVLPNGNLVISGTQEVRVNFELRVLTVIGIVRPRDIARDNTIAYDRIAEARVSYGGRGRITEVQQPRLIHQILDIVSPF